ncbi:MAG: extracellular solute-binding protein [Clostridia bacterium]|nr:extracellular solute-binding protein [Clostridia bacterium]
MKKSLRLICLVLAIALSVACLAGCGEEATSSNQDATSSNVESKKETDKFDDYTDNELPDYDLGGVTLLVASGFEDILFPDEEANELAARRKKWIDDCKTQYNFELEHVYYAWDKMTDTLMPDLISGEYVADFVLPVIRQAGPFIQARLCYDLASGDFAKYLDFTKPWWDRTMTKASTIAGKTYCCTPQFTSAANTTWVCFFNRSLMEELEVDPDSIYDMQENGTWTWDKFRELSKKAVKDLNADGNMDHNDRWGFTSARWHIFNNFVTVAGLDYVIEKDNKFVYNLNNSEAITALTTMNEIFTSDNIYWAGEAGAAGDNPGMLGMFSADKALFMLYSVDACQRPQIREMESDFGMVLTPKYKEGSEYISRAEQTTKCLFVPVTAQYKLETAFAVQALSYNAWKIGVPDIMELNFAQYVRDDGSEYCIYEVFNHTTFTVDQLLFAVGVETTWLNIINTNLSTPCTQQPGADMSGAVQTISTQVQTLLNEFYGQATES